MPASYADGAGEADESPDIPHSFVVDGKVAMVESAQKPATRKSALDQTAIRYFMVPLLTPVSFYDFHSRSVTVDISPMHTQSGPAISGAISNRSFTG
jgi:hypothetical protein